MKTIITFLSLSAIPAMAVDFNFEGTFHESRQTLTEGFTASSCTDKGGEWTAEGCVLSVDNEIVLVKTDAPNHKTFSGKVAIASYDSRTCNFDGTFTMIPGYRLVSVTRPYGEDKPACKVIVRFLAPSRSSNVEVTTMGDGCAFYCNAGVSMMIQNAERVN